MIDDVMRVTCLLIIVSFIFGSYGQQCVTRDRCSCVFDDGSGMIDLSSIGNTDGSPLFLDQVSAVDYYWYSYNPCRPFQEGTCSNVAACLYDYSYDTYYDIGSADSASFSYNGLTTDIYYESANKARTTIVTLVCSPSQKTPTLQVTGEQITNYYSMTLSTAAACKVPISSNDKSSGGISGGSVLLIVFFAILSVYMVAGIGFNRYRNSSTGTELIPNINFWRSLPGLIKDGYRFTLGLTCRKTVYVSI